MSAMVCPPECRAGPSGSGLRNHIDRSGDVEPWNVPPPAVAAPAGITSFFRSQPGKTIPGQPLDTAALPHNTVLVHLYDLGDDELLAKINRYSTMNDRVLIGGVYHAGVEIYGTEWSYGGIEEGTGVWGVEPRCNPQHTYRATVEMGLTRLSPDEVDVLLEQLMQAWPGASYDFLNHNCLDFANEFCIELGLGRMPGWVDRYGRTAQTLEAITRNTVHGVSNTRELVRSVSTDAWGSLDSAVRGARTEAPKVGELVQATAQTLSSTFSRFGQSLFTAAASTATHMSSPSSDKSKGTSDKQGQSGLAASLRNRGGIVKCSSPKADGRRTEDVKDPFLLEGMLQGGTSIAMSAVEPSPTKTIESGHGNKPSIETDSVERSIAENKDTTANVEELASAADAGMLPSAEVDRDVLE
mmetsp:Transcript_66533/g.124115  ORF Transcript_66533/g.124115 Transcript_66533/m.124115 type:complete len:412 (+) Transcript_66533:68-1303(+)